MHNGEWSLISFTLLSQLSVGLMMAFGFIFFKHYAVVENFSVGLSYKTPEFIVLVIVLIATLLSLFHLGSPQHAYHSLNNLKGSWISREILMLSVFGLTVLLFMISRIFSWQAIYTKIFLLMNLVSGLVLILAMSGIYKISTVPSWNHFNTPVSFFGSAFMMGFTSFLLFIIFSKQELMSSQMMRQCILILLVVVGVLFISAVIHYYQLSKFHFTGIVQIVFKKGWFLTLFLIRSGMILLIILGLVYLVFFALNSAVNLDLVKTILLIIFMLILLEEILGRYQFYASYFRLGV